MTKAWPGLRVGVDEAYCTEGVEPIVAQGVEDALAALAGAGAKIVPIAMPEHDELIHLWAPFCAAECAVHHAETYPARAAEYGPSLKGLIDAGIAASGLELARANVARSAFKGRLARIFQTIDLIAAPSFFMATPLDSAIEALAAGADGLYKLTRLHRPLRFLGQPDPLLALRLLGPGSAARLPADRATPRRGPVVARGPRLPASHRLGRAASGDLRCFLAVANREGKLFQLRVATLSVLLNGLGHRGAGRTAPDEVVNQGDDAIAERARTDAASHIGVQIHALEAASFGDALADRPAERARVRRRHQVHAWDPRAEKFSNRRRIAGDQGRPGGQNLKYLVGNGVVRALVGTEHPKRGGGAVDPAGEVLVGHPRNPPQVRQRVLR